jgi:molecular chaperone GrpE
MANDENAVPEEQQETKTTPNEPGQPQGPQATTQNPAQNPAQGSAAESSGEEQETKMSKDETNKLEQLQQELDETKAKAEENWNEYLRACAELENTKRRMQRDIESAHKFAVEKFIVELLPVKDSLEMGLNASKENNGNIEKLIEGMELTLKMFSDAVNKFGVEVLDPIDQPFNPEFHQAMSMQESNVKPQNTVLAVMQKGYTMHGRLVRPAMVVVSKGPANPADQDSEKVGLNIDEQA